MKNEENWNHDYLFVFIIAVITIIVSSVIQNSIFSLEPCGINTYEKETFCYDCISPLGAFCNTCSEFGICDECKKGYYIGKV